MAEPMRESPLRDSSHRGKVAEPGTTKPATTSRDPPAPSNNFDDDNEWDIGIGDLIIDLDADIEKTTDARPAHNNNMASAGTPAKAKVAAAAAPAGGVEHSATVDKGLKMKIKRTKPGTKEAKHEIVKTQTPPAEPSTNGADAGGPPAPAPPPAAPSDSPAKPSKHGSGSGSGSGGGSSSSGAKRAGSSGHRRDKGVRATPDKVNGAPAAPPAAAAPQQAPQPSQAAQPQQPPASAATDSEAAAPAAPPAPQPPLVFPGAPPTPPPPAPGPPQAKQPAVAATAQAEPPAKVPASPAKTDDSSASPPPSKKLKTAPSVNCTTNGATDAKVDVSDVCVGTSVGTITEPDCLGPCEPGTSVTLEGIVWNETEGGVLVVNVTWRGKTYVGTLLDCTKHDWAPPRFCDSPTSDLDARTPKGRGKRGRSAASSTPANDLSNFTETRSSVHSKLRNGAKGRRGAAGSPAPPSAPPAFPRPDASNKRKGRPSEPDEPTKRSRSGSRGPTASPPASPVLLECPEPNCSKKYKHINGLKYHQSHAHGANEEELDTKDGAISLSENDESNAEPPSVPPSPSPDKGHSPQPKSEPKEATPEPPPVEEATQAPSEKVPRRFGDDPAAPTPFVPVAKAAPTTIVAPPVLNVPTPPKPLQPTDASVDKYKVKIPASPLKVSPPQQQPPVPTPPVQPIVKPAEKAKTPTPMQTGGSTTPKKKPPPAVGSPQPEQHNGGLPVASPPASVGLMAPEGRDEVQSPAYSDISDDGAPVEPEDKAPPKPGEKKPEGGAAAPLGPYGLYPYYGQAPPAYLPVDAAKAKADEKLDKLEKEKKEEQKAASHFYPYAAYYPYNLDAAAPFPMSVMSGAGDKFIEEKEFKIKEEKVDKEPVVSKHLSTPPSKSIKSEKQNENHQILKESIEMKSQLGGDKAKFYDYPYQMYQRQQEELRRYYLHAPSDKQQQRKEPQPLDATVGKEAKGKAAGPPPKPPAPQPPKEDKKEDKAKQQEGVKPTMETQGPPPPTNSYAYFNAAQYSPHYGALPFDPNHPVYRGMSPMLVPGPYGATPYLAPPPPAPMRYPGGPEDLSRPPPKALDVLQHHASQFAYSSHKMHELQERALKSPTPKAAASAASSATSAPTPPAPGAPPAPGPPRPSSGGANPPGQPPGSKNSPPAPPPPSEKEAPAPLRSPPPQRHVHTHHHTHVGLGYPILPGQYPSPYGAAVLTTQQVAASASVVNPVYPAAPAPK